MKNENLINKEVDVHMHRKQGQLSKWKNKWKNKWRVRGIRNRLLLNITVLVILSISACTAVLSLYWSKEKIDTFDQYSREITEQISKFVDASMQNLDQLAITIAYSDDIQRILKIDYSKQFSRYSSSRKSASWYLMNVKKAYNGIESIYVYDKQGYLFSSPMAFSNPDYVLESEEWLEEFKNSDAVSCIVGPRINYQQTYPQNEVITVVRKIRNLDNLEETGYVFINVRMEDILNNNLQKIWNADNGALLIVTENQEIIFDSGNLIGKNEEIDDGLMQGLYEKKNVFNYSHGRSRYRVVFSKCENSGWNIIRTVEMNKLFASTRRMIWFSAVLMILIILITLVVMRSFADSFLDPIIRIQKSMQKFMDNNFELFAERSDDETAVLIEKKSEDEIELLSSCYNQMVMKMYSMIHSLYQNEQEKHKLEMEALSTQISPHFTYNTLGTIKQMALLQSADGIADMVDAIINLLRATARYGEGISSLEQELGLLRDYINIMQMRYYDDFEYEINADKETLQVQIPCMMLQPIVENAILHGVLGIERQGVIEIRTWKEEEVLCITVKDNGKGFDPAYVKALQEGAERNVKGRDNIGIYNVHRRIQLYYGTDYGLDFQKNEPEGTIVTIRIPFEEAEKNV